MSCSGGNKGFTPRTSTSQAYRPAPKTMMNRQPSITGARGSNNMSRAATFGTPRVKLTGRNK